MNKEDYFKYYIQGSDHYLIPRDIFEELFNEMNNWKEENQQLKEENDYYFKKNIELSTLNTSLRSDRDLYKEVIEEVREYVNTKLRDVNLTYGIDNEFREEYDDLLQILDKVKENK